MSDFSGPCKIIGNEPIRNDPVGPGIRLANIIFLLPLNLTNIITTQTDNAVKINAKHHIFDSFNFINCKKLFIKYV